jgi:hypothetical protein
MRKILALAVVMAALTATVITLVGSAVTADAVVPMHTTKIVVRPVHADGRPVKGYRVVREHYPFDFDCGEVSPMSVSGDVYWCGFTVTNTMACWKSAHHTVLCLRDPRVKTLVRIRYTGALHHVARRAHPHPAALRLGVGNYCRIRGGGAWSPVTGHPTWYGTYYCTRGDLYGPLRGNGIDKSRDPWRVHVVKHAGQANQHVRTFRVAKAYYVGTAR